MKASMDNFENGGESFFRVGTRRRRVRTARRGVRTLPKPFDESRPPIGEASVCWRAAFTLIELLVVMTTMAILAVMLLPALAGTQAQSKTTACTARFRQWAASANLYANDNRGWLPAFVPNGGGDFAWDVGSNIVDALYPFGLDIPDYFCPMRPVEWDAANAWGLANYGHPIQNSSILHLYLSRNFPAECVLNDNFWVPRGTSPGSTTTFPTDYSSKSQIIWPPWLKNEPTPTFAVYGWPQRLHDISVPYVPIVNDSAGSGNFPGLLKSPVVGPNVTNISPTTAHFVNGTLLGVNLAYADGHVVSHTPNQMRCVYFNGSGGSAIFWFY